jgi:hypothetical protein
MKAYGKEYYAVGYNMQDYCVGCLPDGVDMFSGNCLPILADSEWDYVPVCCVCGKEHTYMKILNPEATCKKRSDIKEKVVFEKRVFLGKCDDLKRDMKNCSVFAEIAITKKYYGLVLSIVCCMETPDSVMYLYGQQLEAIQTYFKSDARIKRILDVRSRWNKNDTHPGCEHQRALGWEKPSSENPHIPENYYGNIRRPCSTCGYKFGSATRYEVLPKEIVEEIMSW